jgi:hypothetical protein
MDSVSDKKKQSKKNALNEEKVYGIHGWLEISTHNMYYSFHTSVCVAKSIYMLWGILEGRRWQILAFLIKYGKYPS